MGSTARAIELLNEAIHLLQEPPTPIRAAQAPAEDEMSFTGSIGRPELKQVGRDGVALFTAGLKYRREIDARFDWINLVAWRNTALWANDNLTSGSVVTVKGRFENQEWTDQGGEKKQRTVFSVRVFEPA
jgi:single-stranded DNA-binding protein